MKPAERDKLLTELHEDIHYMLHEVKVNGHNGTEPVIGLEPILEHLNTKIYELQDITSTLRKNRNLRKAVSEWVDTKPVLRLAIKNPYILWLVISGLAGWLANLNFHFIK